MAQHLTEAEVIEAKLLYQEFRDSYPGQKNPSDINTPEKREFLRIKGPELIALMQRARKQAYDFTRLPGETEDDSNNQAIHRSPS